MMTASIDAYHSAGTGQAGGTERGMTKMDKERVEGFSIRLNSGVTNNDLSFSWTTADKRGLVADWLAMYAIVEALAAKNPIEWDEIEALDGRPGYRCRYCGSLNPSDDPESFIHNITCEWCDAATLIGPAGAREEANG